MAAELKLAPGQLRDIAAALEAAGAAAAKPNIKPEDVFTLYQSIRKEIDQKGLAPKV